MECKLLRQQTGGSWRWWAGQVTDVPGLLDETVIWGPWTQVHRDEAPTSQPLGPGRSPAELLGVYVTLCVAVQQGGEAEGARPRGSPEGEVPAAAPSAFPPPGETHARGWAPGEAHLP